LYFVPLQEVVGVFVHLPCRNNLKQFKEYMICIQENTAASSRDIHQLVRGNNGVFLHYIKTVKLKWKWFGFNGFDAVSMLPTADVTILFCKG
jgi:hypothetical protein